MSFTKKVNTLDLSCQSACKIWLSHSEFYSPVFPLTIRETVNLGFYVPLSTFHDVANKKPNGKSLMLNEKEIWAEAEVI